MRLPDADSRRPSPLVGPVPEPRGPAADRPSGAPRSEPSRDRASKSLRDFPSRAESAPGRVRPRREPRGSPPESPGRGPRPEAAPFFPPVPGRPEARRSESRRSPRPGSSDESVTLRHLSFRPESAKPLVRARSDPRPGSESPARRTSPDFARVSRSAPARRTGSPVTCQSSPKVAPPPRLDPPASGPASRRKDPSPVPRPESSRRKDPSPVPRRASPRRDAASPVPRRASPRNACSPPRRASSRRNDLSSVPPREFSRRNVLSSVPGRVSPVREPLSPASRRASPRKARSSVPRRSSSRRLRSAGPPPEREALRELLFAFPAREPPARSSRRPRSGGVTRPPRPARGGRRGPSRGPASSVCPGAEPDPGGPRWWRCRRRRRTCGPRSCARAGSPRRVPPGRV